MFAPNSPMTLTDVTFTTEEEDDATHRVVVCTFAISPFTSAQAEALAVRSLLFDTETGLPKEAIDTIVLNIAMPLQRVSFAMAPDQERRRIVIPDVAIDEKLRAKVKKDRDPLAVDATLKISFRYPDANVLLYIANGVNDVHYLTFEAQQGDLLADHAGEELRPGVLAEH